MSAPLRTTKRFSLATETRLFNPASNVKLVTTAAALWFLGPNYRFKTVVYRDRGLKEGIVDGNLYIKGHGDPTLTNESIFPASSTKLHFEA